MDSSETLAGGAPAAGWDCHVHVFDAGAPVSPGHYRPVHRPLADIEALAQSHGFGHLVLVQPSVYGTDNSVLLDALASSAGRHRGIVVPGDGVTEEDLRAMHALGVRGVRYNLVSPVGNSGDPARSFEALAPLLRTLGWHVQWYARPEDLPRIAGLHTASGLTPVLDHLGGLHAGLPADGDGWRALARLAAAGSWVKLSGWYRLHSRAPYTALDPVVRRIARLFGPRMVWGSDWPHTTFAPSALPAYASVVAPVARVLDRAQQEQAFREGPRLLYT